MDKKLILIGIDAMDFGTVTRLLDQGELPNLNRLRKKGAFLKLRTSTPPETPVAWTQIATGMNPGQNNIFDFIRRDAPSYTPKLSLARERPGLRKTVYEPYVTTAPFWKALCDAGIPASVYRWPVTFPPDDLDGNMLSGLGVPDLRGMLGGYSYYSTEDLKQPGGGARVFRVHEEDGTYKSSIAGPNVIKAKGSGDSSVPIQIDVRGKGCRLILQEQEISLEKGRWSRWFTIVFKTGLFSSVSGMMKAYLVSREPLRLYMTSLQIDPKRPSHAITYPKEYSKELSESIGDFYTLGIPEETGGYVDGYLSKDAFADHIREIEEEREKQFWTGFEYFRKRGGFFGFVFDSLDRLQHVMWNEEVGRRSEHDIDDMILWYYEEKDKLIGKVMDEVDDKTLMMVVSDHGMAPFKRSVNINSWLRREGYLSLRSDTGSSLFKDVDWKRTRAYAVGFTNIYLNIKGREKEGIIDPQEREVLAKELISKLTDLQDHEKGRKVIRDAWFSDDIYEGKAMQNSPDVVIGFEEGYRMDWSSPIGGLTEDVIYDNERRWTGDHLMHPDIVPGVLFCSEKIARAEADQLMIAPSILEFFSVSKETESRSLLGDQQKS